MKLYFLAAPLLGAAVFVAFAASANASPAITINAGKLLAGPGVNYAAVGSLPAGTHINVLSCNRSGWCQINRFNHTGWVPFANLDSHLYMNVGTGARVHEYVGHTSSAPAGTLASPAAPGSSTPSGPKFTATPGGLGSAKSADDPGGGKSPAPGNNSSFGGKGGGRSIDTTAEASPVGRVYGSGPSLVSDSSLTQKIGKLIQK